MIYSDFDVLVPIKGNCEYLEQTLQSILNSTILPKQVILVDDGIEPKVLALIQNFSKLLPIVFVKNMGNGVVDACNTGIQLSTSKYIARLDSDDLAMPIRFERQIDKLEECSNFAVVGSRVYYINDQSKITGVSNHPIGIINRLKAFNNRCLLAQPSVMIRRSKLNEVGNYKRFFQFSNFDIAEDFLLWLRISKVGDLFNFEEPLTKYRQHEAQVSKVNLVAVEIITQLIAVSKVHSSSEFPIVNVSSCEETMIYLNKLKNLAFPKSLYLRYLAKILCLQLSSHNFGFMPRFAILTLKIFRKIDGYRFG